MIGFWGCLYQEQSEAWGDEVMESVVRSVWWRPWCSGIFLKYACPPASRSRVPSSRFRGGRIGSSAGHYAESGSTVDRHAQLSGLRSFAARLLMSRTFRKATDTQHWKLGLHSWLCTPWNVNWTVKISHSEEGQRTWSRDTPWYTAQGSWFNRVHQLLQ